MLYSNSYVIPTNIQSVCFRSSSAVSCNSKMAVFSSGVLCFTLCVAYINAAFITGKPNHKEALRFDFIMTDITNCIGRYRTTNTFRSKLHTFFCMSSRISECVVSETVDYIRKESMMLPTELKTTYCGIIASRGRINQERNVIIKVRTYLNYILNIEINQFNFEWRLTGCVVHNMVIIDRQNNKRSVFCGKRSPWTMVTTGHEADVHITVSHYRKYHLTSFYSSYKPQWFDTFAENQRLYVKSPDFSHITTFAMFKRLEVDVIKYYLLSDPSQVLVLGVSWNVSDGSNSRLVIHDGPGHLSRILVKYTDKSIKMKSHVQTTAFAAFIQISSLQLENNNVKMTMAAISSDYYPECHMKGTSFALTSNYTRNTVCLFRARAPGEHVGKGSYTAYTVVYIESFTLNGPHDLVDGSPHNCHYGGMFISHLIDTSNRMFPICDNKYKLYISGRYIHMAALIVWYAKYTSGSIRATFAATRCFITYLELANYPNYLKDRSFNYTGNPGCQRFVYPPREVQDQQRCKMTFATNTGAFGAAYIKTILHPTVYHCIPEYSKPVLDQIITLEATISENWPLGTPKTVTIYDTIGRFGQLKERFPYLYNATAVFNDVCEGTDNRQIMLRLEVSVCQKTSFGKSFLRQPGFIQAASDACYNFNHVITHYPKNATHLLYKEGIKEHRGGSLTVTYDKECPGECRNYTFLLFVLKRKHNFIEEYRVNVGNSVFLGLSHNGFRLILQPPLLHCKCDVRAKMVPPIYKIMEKVDKPPPFWTTQFGDIFPKQ